MTACDSTFGGRTMAGHCRGSATLCLLLVVCGLFPALIYSSEANANVVVVESINDEPTTPREQQESKVRNEKHDDDARRRRRRVAGDECSSQCLAKQELYNQHYGGNLLDAAEMKRLATKAREDMIAMLRPDYGEYFDRLFLPDDDKTVSRAKKAIISVGNYGRKERDDTTSEKRFRRKLMIKLLRVQTNLAEKLKTSVEGCECSPKSSGAPNEASNRKLSFLRNRVLSNNNNETETTWWLDRFVWATGGHSAAAGHGNFCNQSYTAYLERAAASVFASVGLELEGRNYAMGGMRSGPECALCNVAVYGADADVITWDFGMTDGRAYWRKGLYTHRVGMHPNRPAYVDINADNIHHAKHGLGISQHAQDHGRTMFWLDSAQIAEMQKLLPDMMGMTQDDIDNLPFYVNHYKCDDHIESGEPDCRQYKYFEKECSNRKGRVSWHPGFKVNAVYGNLMAFFLVDSLLEAIDELEGIMAEKNIQTVETMLQKLEQDEADDAAEFHQADVSKPARMELNPNATQFIDHLYRRPLYCFTALLPSQQRYKGISMFEVDGPDLATNYPLGKSLRLEASRLEQDDGGSLELVYTDEEIEKCSFCYRMDYKNYFYANHKMGWSGLDFPNERGAAAYGKYMQDASFDKVVIVVCTVLCDW